MRRLGGRVDDDLDVAPKLAEQLLDAFAVADIQRMVLVARKALLQQPAGFGGRGVRSEVFTRMSLSTPTRSKPSAAKRLQVSEPMSPAEPVTRAMLMQERDQRWRGSWVRRARSSRGMAGVF